MKEKSRWTKIRFFLRCYRLIPGDAGVAEATLRVGGHLLNDMSAFPTARTHGSRRHYGTGFLIMHSVGLPKQRHTEVQYADVLQTLDQFFDQKIKEAMAAGVSREAIVLDPGIDFAKQKPDNLRIYRDLKLLTRFERPILLPISRKTVIGDVLKSPTLPIETPVPSPAWLPAPCAAHRSSAFTMSMPSCRPSGSFTQ